MVVGSDFGLLEPVVGVIGNAVGTLKYVLGGIFGVYLVLLVVKVYQGYMFRKELQAIREEMKTMRQFVQRIEHLQERKVRSMK